MKWQVERCAIKKNKAGQRDTVFYWVVREGVSGDTAFKQRPERECGGAP